MALECTAGLSCLFQNIFFILIGCFGMGFLIGFHELGHFLCAKFFGVRTPSFSIGMGPKLFTKKIGDTEFSFSAIPLGGYVEIAGAAEVGQGDQKEAHATDTGSFASKPYYQKLCILLGGIVFNLIFAYSAFIFLFATGIPKTPLIQKPIISVIQPESPADKHTLLVGDRIVSINNEAIENNIYKIQNILQPLAAQEAIIVVERDKTLIEKTIIVGEKNINGTSVGFLGVEFEISDTPAQSLSEAIKNGITLTHTWIINTAQAFTQLKKNSSELAGPVMIIAMTTKAASAGFKILLFFLAIISINLAVLNVIPLPILDGGQILFYTIEAIIGRPLPDKVREYIHIATWIMFLLLFLVLTTKDIYRIASPYVETIRLYFK